MAVSMISFILYVFLLSFLFRYSTCIFTWNPPLGGGLDVQSSVNPNCIGGFDIIFESVLYPCFGGSIATAPSEGACGNGLHGIMLNSTLTCGVISEYFAPGQGGCVNGGYAFLSNTLNFTNCYANDSYASSVLTTHFYDHLLLPYTQNNTQQYLDALAQLQSNNNISLTILGGQLNALSANFYALAMIGDNVIVVTKLNATAFRLEFVGVLQNATSITGDGFISIANPQTNEFALSFAGSLLSGSPFNLAIAKNTTAGTFTLTVTVPTLTSVGTGASWVALSNETLHQLKSMTAGPNILINSNTNDNQVSLVGDVVTNSVSVGNGFSAKNGSSFYLYNAANTFYNALFAASGLSANLSWALPTSAGVIGQYMILSSTGQLGFSTLPVDLFTLLAGSNMIVTQNGVNNYSVATSSTPSFTSMTLSTALPIASGGTGASSLAAFGVLVMNSGGTAQSSIPLSNGQILIGSTGGAAAAATLTGTSNQISFTVGSNSITALFPNTVIFPGNVQDSTGMYFSTSATVSAAGATQGTATALTTSYSVITTVASGTGVVLMTPAKAGLINSVANLGANILTVYPASGGAIGGNAVNAGILLSVGETITFLAQSTTQWYIFSRGELTSFAPSTRYMASSIGVLVQNNPGAGVFVTAIPTISGTQTIKAGRLQVGSKILFRIDGFFRTAGGGSAPTLTWRIRLDGVTVYGPSISSASIAGVSSQGFFVEAALNIFSIGASGTALPSGSLQTAGTTVPMTTTVARAIDTTIDHSFDLQIAFSTLSASNTFTVTSVTIQHIKT